MNANALKAAALVIFGVAFTTPATAQDRPPGAKTEAAAAVFGLGTSAVSLDDEELAGQSGDAKGKLRKGDFGSAPNSLAGRAATPESNGAFVPNNQPTHIMVFQPVLVSPGAPPLVGGR